MQIVIPMSGFGERFRAQGYTKPKPLIEIDDRSIISYVVDMFPGENNLFFICNEDHLSNASYGMESHLKSICPSATVIGIPPHKLGPIHAVTQVKSHLDMSQAVLVNYCDFTCYWDWKHFKQSVNDLDVDGAIPAYRGFHPHSLGSTNYAYIKEVNYRLQDIQEKQPFTDNRMQEFASSGTYYFKSAELMYQAFDWVVENNVHVNNEYYISVAYQYLVKNNLETLVYPLQHFMQWGTPEDVTEYLEWSQVFRRMVKTDIQILPKSKGSLIVPMAGLGKRFQDEGYVQTKPLIEVSGRSMVTTAIQSCPKAQQNMFVLRQDMPGVVEIQNELKRNFNNAQFHVLKELTEGQAITTLEGLKALLQNKTAAHEPITVAACDNAILFNHDQWNELSNDNGWDVEVWGGLNHVNAKRRPEMFGWIDYDIESLDVLNVSVKQPIDDTLSHPIVIGMFTFRNAEILEQCIETLVSNNHRINNEFYLDSAVNEALKLGLRCKVFIVDHFISFGTPNDLKTFEYWQSCFSKWHAHPYELKLDRTIPEDKVASLQSRYAQFDEQVF
jgi:NDP-sugar pyrophosphorylase family protein